MAPWNESEVPQASDMVTLFTDTLSCLQTHLNGTNLWAMRKTMLVASSRCHNIDIRVLYLTHFGILKISEFPSF